MPDATAFGHWLKQCRQALDLTQGDLARRVGCARITIVKIERGERRPSRQVAERIAEVLGLPPADRTEFLAWVRGVAGASLPAQPVPAPLPPASVAPPPAVADNLPATVTSFLGRDHDVMAVCRLLWRADVRLVTVTGPPGIGKTRLSLAVAATLRADFAHGVCFVSLAALRDPALVPDAVAAALGLTDTPGQSRAERLPAYLHDKALLLVLDNFEQVAGAATTVAAWLAAAPRLKVLVTSRAVLRLYGEHEYSLAPLALPDLRALPAPAALAQIPAVTLFVQRAQAVRFGFQLTPENGPAVAEICVRLDGLPLAIELAAARSRHLAPEAILARLGQRLALLTGGPRDHTPRQRTLQGAILWSYDLLEPADQALFYRLAIFVGGATPAAVEAILSSTPDGPLATRSEPPGAPLAPTATGEVLDLLEGLADKSLLQRDVTADGPRYRMLETIREFAAERLAASGEAPALRRRHATFFLTLAEEAEAALRGPGQRRWLATLEAEHDNLRAALSNALGDGDAGLALRLANALGRFWLARGHWREGRRWLRAALAAGSEAPAPLRARVLGLAGALAENQGERAQALAAFDEALGLFRAAGDQLGIATTLSNLGNIAVAEGDYARGRAYYGESLHLVRALGDTRKTVTVLNNLGVVSQRQGEYPQATEFFEESLALLQQLGDRGAISNALNNLGMMAYTQGQYPRAAALYTESLALRRELGDRSGIATALNNLGTVVLRQGDVPQARSLYTESLGLRRELGEKVGIAYSLESWAGLAAREDQFAWAAQLCAAAAALRDAIQTPLPPSERGDYEQLQATLRAHLREPELAAAQATGQALPLEEIVAAILAEATVA